MTPQLGDPPTPTEPTALLSQSENLRCRGRLPDPLKTTCTSICSRQSCRGICPAGSPATGRKVGTGLSVHTAFTSIFLPMPERPAEDGADEGGHGVYIWGA